MAYCGDVLEELVGVAEACRRDHRGTGRQGTRHKVRVLDPQVSAEHPPVAGEVAELAQGTPSAPPPARETRRPLSVQAVPTPTSSAFSGPPTLCLPGPDASQTHRSSGRGRARLLGGERRHGHTCRQRRWPGRRGPRAPAAAPGAALRSQPGPAPPSAAPCTRAPWTAPRKAVTFRSNAAGRWAD